MGQLKIAAPIFLFQHRAVGKGDCVSVEVYRSAAVAENSVSVLCGRSNRRVFDCDICSVCREESGIYAVEVAVFGV